MRGRGDDHQATDVAATGPSSDDVRLRARGLGALSQDLDGAGRHAEGDQGGARQIVRLGEHHATGAQGAGPAREALPGEHDPGSDARAPQGGDFRDPFRRCARQHDDRVGPGGKGIRHDEPPRRPTERHACGDGRGEGQADDEAGEATIGVSGEPARGLLWTAHVWRSATWALAPRPTVCTRATRAAGT